MGRRSDDGTSPDAGPGGVLMGGRDGARLDLVFGLLALQNGMITRDQLVAAFAVATASGRPMAELLVEQGALAAHRRELLDALAAEHLALHGGDAEASLAAIGRGAPTAAVVLPVGPGAGPMDGLLRAPEPGDTVTMAPDESGGMPAGGAHRFVVKRPHARGGLGAVYIALDRELNREVALKQILDEHAENPMYCGRFLREAEITGRLEHPAIVPVYSFGRLEDGRPYYAMRLIRGTTMAAAIARFHSDPGLQADPPRRALELRKLLGRFLTVCDAVAYAHGRGVLHRDLKPRNVMLGEYGETLVVDWGLAKATGYRDPMAQIGESTLRPGTGSDSSETQAGVRLGTPGYMSPEQAAGRLDDLGPASDVYSLGATLYALLAGVPPHIERDIPALLARLERGDVTPPRRVKPWVDPALEAVCLKAMSTRLEDRYPSARALADDLQNWLADEPVTAWREPATRRIGRWARRNRTPVVTAALCLIGVVYLWNESRLRRLQRQATAEGRVAALVSAEAREMPRIAEELRPDLALVERRLRSLASPDRPPRDRLASSLALLPVDPSRADFLAGCALSPTSAPEEVLVIRGALEAHRHDDRIARRMAGIVADAKADGDVRLRAAGVLARLAPEDPVWPGQAGAVARLLVRESPLRIDAWRQAFQPVAGHLAPPLLGLLADGEPGEADDRAFALLLAWARLPGNRRGPEEIAALLAESGPERLAELAGSLGGAAERARAVAALTAWVREAALGDAAGSRRQGRIVRALLHLEEFDAIWPLLRQVPDSGTRAEVIEQLAPGAVDPARLVDRLLVEKDVSSRRALVLALGRFSRKVLPADRLPALEETMLRWYRDEPDAGLHGAVGWLLREGWGLGQSVRRIDRELAGDAVPEDREWYVSRTGQDFSVIRGPITFLLASDKPGSRGGESGEPWRQVRIPRSYAIAACEVRMGDYLKYLDEGGEKRRDLREAFMFSQLFPSMECPAGMVSWYDAAGYCNWLSRREGIAEDQWCYPRRCEPGMELPVDHLERTGYRLPTEAEWEYACKSGSILAPRHYGYDDARLGAYAWFAGNTRDQFRPVGEKKPNDFGLFDMLGNVYEWCLASGPDSTPMGPGPVVEDRLVSRLISEEGTQVVRGGASNNQAAFVRTARRVRLKPSSELQQMGFRVVRTCPGRR